MYYSDNSLSMTTVAIREIMNMFDPQIGIEWDDKVAILMEQRERDTVAVVLHILGLDKLWPRV